LIVRDPSNSQSGGRYGRRRRRRRRDMEARAARPIQGIGCQAWVLL
jgi:hypothetical protein